MYNPADSRILSTTKIDVKCVFFFFCPKFLPSYIFFHKLWTVVASLCYTTWYVFEIRFEGLSTNVIIHEVRLRKFIALLSGQLIFVILAEFLRCYQIERRKNKKMRISSSTLEFRAELVCQWRRGNNDFETTTESKIQNIFNFAEYKLKNYLTGHVLSQLKTWKSRDVMTCPCFNEMRREYRYTMRSYRYARKFSSTANEERLRKISSCEAVEMVYRCGNVVIN